MGRYTLTVTGDERQNTSYGGRPAHNRAFSPARLWPLGQLSDVDPLPRILGFSTLLVNSTGGFAGTVTLTGTVSPVFGNGPATTLNPGQIVLSSWSDSSIQFSHQYDRDHAKATYTILVAGSSGSLHHSIVITLTVQ